MYQFFLASFLVETTRLSFPHLGMDGGWLQEVVALKASAHGSKDQQIKGGWKGIFEGFKEKLEEHLKDFKEVARGLWRVF